MAKLDVVSDTGGDWIAFYIDENLLEEGHSLSPYHLLSSLEGLTIDTVKFWEFDFQAENVGSGFPSLGDYTGLIPD